MMSVSSRSLPLYSSTDTAHCPPALEDVGLERLAIRIDRAGEAEVEHPRGRGRAHTARPQPRHVGVIGADQMALDDVAHLGGTAPAQGDAAAAMPVIMDDEL